MTENEDHRRTITEGEWEREPVRKRERKRGEGKERGGMSFICLHTSVLMVWH